MEFDIANPTTLATVRTALSATHLAPFDLHAGNDPVGGLALYEWNILAGAAFFQTLHTVEVKARRRLRTQGYPDTPDRIVTELSFGFWRFLPARRYHLSLWVPAIRHGFPHLNPPARTTVAEPVARLHQLRNRIAHHEPIYKRDLDIDLADARSVLGAVSPAALAWAEAISSLPGVLGDRPAIVRIPLPRGP